MTLFQPALWIPARQKYPMPKRVKSCRSKAKNRQMNMIRVEFAPEPDAETEPRASNDGRPLTELPHAATCQVMEAAPRAATTDHTAASSTANGIGEAVSERV